VRSVAISADGEYLAAGSGDKNVYLAERYGVFFDGIKTIVKKPRKIQFMFSLKDTQGHAFIADPETIKDWIRVYENDEEIDYKETNFFVHSAENFQSEVVVVLDFTNSMANWEENGKTGIDVMVEAAKSLVNQLSASHRIAIIEYHDENVDPTLLRDFTTNKALLLSAIDSFNNSGFDPGGSRCWDAVNKGLSTFSSGEGSDDSRKTLLFLSDGRDTSSRATPEELKDRAISRGIQIYNVGCGDVYNESNLKSISETTEGIYYRADDINALRQTFEDITRDLAGQYKLSYTSLRKSGRYNVRISLDFYGARDEFIENINMDEIYGDTRVGTISFDKTTLENKEAHVFARTEHIPRNITEIIFALDTIKNITVTLPSEEDGGLCENWNLEEISTHRYKLTSDEPIEFGNFGLLFKVIVKNVKGSGMEIPFEMNNSIYSSGKRLEYPRKIIIGIPIAPTANAGSNKTVLKDTEVYLNGTGQDDSVITNYEWDFDGDGIYDWESIENGFATYTYYTPGAYEVELRVTDDNGMTGMDVYTITVSEKVENSPPRITLNSPLDNSTMTSTFPVLSWNGTDDDRDSLKYDVYLDTTPHPTIKVIGGQSQKSYTSSGLINNETYYWKVIVSDDISETESEIWSFLIDVSTPNQKPTTTITRPSAKQKISGTSITTYVITGTALDNEFVQLVEIKIDDNPWIEVSGTTSWSYEWNMVPLNSGFHIIYARSYDGELYSDFNSVTIEYERLFIDENSDPGDISDETAFEQYLGPFPIYSYVIMFGIVIGVVISRRRRRRKIQKTERPSSQEKESTISQQPMPSPDSSHVTHFTSTQEKEIPENDQMQRQDFNSKGQSTDKPPIDEESVPIEDEELVSIKLCPNCREEIEITSVERPLVVICLGCKKKYKLSK